MSRLLLLGSLASLLGSSFGCAATTPPPEPVSAQRAALVVPAASEPAVPPRPNDASVDRAPDAAADARATATTQDTVSDPFLDATLAIAVRRELNHSADLGVDRVEVRVQDGVLTLTGAVPSWQEAQRAVQLAETTRGLRDVVNHLRVEGQWQDDDLTSWQVSHALTNAGESPQELIRVTQGKVVLGGKVASWAQKERAEIATRNVGGVRDVDNRLVVAPSAPLSDAQLAVEVERHVRADPYVAGQPLEISATDGVVTLRGTLDSVWAKRRALELASIEGARDVDAHALLVSPRKPSSGPPALASADGRTAAPGGAPRDSHALASDASLQRQVRSRLDQHPSISARKIRVSVKRGAVTLLGTVDSDFEKSCAERATRLVPGTGVVENRLRLEPSSAAVPSDAAIARAIEEELWWDARVDPSALRVKVEDGTASVSGSVETTDQRDAILENILQVAPPHLVSDIEVHELDQLARENADFEHE